MHRAWWSALAATTAAYVIYLRTSAPGLGMVDSGELTTVAQTLGIAHPTGYPLFTLIGRLWTFILQMSTDRELVLFSVTCIAVGIGVAVRAIHLRVQRHVESPLVVGVIAISCGLGVALSGVVWSTSAFAEVYPLTFLLGCLIVAMLWRIAESDNGIELWSLLLLTAYVWGLSFGNHLTILWYFPLIAFAVLRVRRRMPIVIKHWLAVPVVFVLGLSTYLFLPLRSALNPVLDWGNPETLRNFLGHASGKQFQVWMFQSEISTVLKRLLSTFAALSGDLGWPLLLLILIGLGAVITGKRAFALVCVGSWLLGMVYIQNYDIPDIATYYVVFIPLLIPVIVEGVIVVSAMIARRVRSTPLRLTVMSMIMISVPVHGAVVNFTGQDQSGNRFSKSLARELLNTLPDSAVVFQGSWDIQSAVIYLQRVEGYRADVTMLDINLMQRPWYIAQETRNHPTVFAGCEAAVAEFLKLEEAWALGKPHDPRKIESAYVEMHNCLMERALAHRPVYVRDAVAMNHPGIGAKFAKRPAAYFYRISREKTDEPFLSLAQLDIETPKRNSHAETLVYWIMNTLTDRGRLAASESDFVTEAECYQSVERLASLSPRLRATLRSGGSSHP